MVFSRLVGAVALLSFALNTIAAPHAVQFSKRADTVKFEIDLTWEEVSHVGDTKMGILVNGTSPGPILNATVGDTVEFLVHNNMDQETTIHFHGITQGKTPWADGVPGLTQKPIEPGESFLYKWEADESGTYWYHAHYRSQIMDGALGAIVIKPASDAERPWSFISNDTEVQKQLTAADDSLQPVFLSDYVKRTSEEFHDAEVAGNLDIACADAITINGKGSQYCRTQEEINELTSPRHNAILANVPSGELTLKGCLPPIPQTQGANFTFDVDAIPSDIYFECNPSEGETEVIEVDESKGFAAITFISSSGFELLKYTIDGHSFWVYAVDGQYITPQLVDTVVINNGDRISCMIPLDQAPADYTIRVTNQGLNQIVSGFATLSYSGSDGADADDSLAIMNYAGTNSTVPRQFAPPRAAPFPAREMAQTPDQTFVLTSRKIGTPYTWTAVGSESFNITREDETPFLFEDPEEIPIEDVVLRTKMGEWIDLIIKIAGPLAQPHPFHKHANKAYVLGQGPGDFPWSSVAEAQAAGVLPPTAFNMRAAPCKFHLRTHLPFFDR